MVKVIVLIPLMKNSVVSKLSGRAFLIDIQKAFNVAQTNDMVSDTIWYDKYQWALLSLEKNKISVLF